LRLCSFGGYGLALAALALMVFGAIECSPPGASNDFHTWSHKKNNDVLTPKWMFGLKLSRLYILSVGIRVYLPGLAPQ